MRLMGKNRYITSMIWSAKWKFPPSISFISHPSFSMLTPNLIESKANESIEANIRWWTKVLMMRLLNHHLSLKAGIFVYWYIIASLRTKYVGSKQVEETWIKVESKDLSRHLGPTRILPKCSVIRRKNNVFTMYLQYLFYSESHQSCIRQF